MSPPLPSADALHSAVRFLQRGVRPDGIPEDGSDWEISSHQWGLFISWSYHHGVSLPATVAPDRDGGLEHDFLCDSAQGRWLKFTKPFASGFTLEPTPEGGFVRRPATPLQYLHRWRLLNRLFDTDVRLAGLSCVGRTQRIVLSQPALTGEPPSWAEIDRALQLRHGLLPVASDDPARRAYRHGRLLLFDVCRTECALASDGCLSPFGAHPQILPCVAADGRHADLPVR